MKKPSIIIVGVLAINWPIVLQRMAEAAIINPITDETANRTLKVHEQIQLIHADIL